MIESFKLTMSGFGNAFQLYGLLFSLYQYCWLPTKDVEGLRTFIRCESTEELLQIESVNTVSKHKI